MPRGSASVDIRAPCAVVFDTIHDYGLRLRWDTMLSDARLLGAARAAKGVRSLCVGTWRNAYLPLETEYVTFEPGVVAAVRLVNESALFERFAASIRHAPLDGGGSRTTYTYSFRLRRFRLGALTEGIVSRLVARETRARLAALRAFVEQGATGPSPSAACSRPPPPGSGAASR